MLDFMTVSTEFTKNGVEVFPTFMIKKSKDLMIRGGDFYAIWDEERKMWSTEEDDVVRLIDNELRRYCDEHKDKVGVYPRVKYMLDASSGSIDKWHKYCQKQLRDSYQMLDETLIFSNMETDRKDYASKRLTYPLEAGECPSYDKLMSTLYDEEERHKIEWAIGAIVTGDSKFIQKFLVLYGSAGTGKSTILNIIQQLFEGYYSVFDAKALGSSSAAFALEAFKTNPLVAIQHDGDLSKIEDNTRLNSLVSHELMTVNEKFKSQYTNRFKCFLFMGTNKPVKITDGKSGLLRRLIDVSPSGRKLGVREYNTAIKQVKFELGAIAHHCKEVYLSDPGKYDDYVPLSMLGATNDFHNFMLDSLHVFKKENGTTLKAAWEMYKNYCEDAKVTYPYSQRIFKEELKEYFWEFEERYNIDDGNRVRNYYSLLKLEKFGIKEEKVLGKKEEKTEKKAVEETGHLIKFEAIPSIFDEYCKDCPAQYATEKETPKKAWDNVTTTLSKINTSKIHYVKVPENHIVIDFDIPDESGNKCFERNLEEASKWPATYAELSKSGAGIHLHYIYTGDVNRLSRIYEDHIEVKVFTGKSSLRRKLTKCNDIPIATISSGLPLKGEDKMIDFEGVKNEKMLRAMIRRNLNKEYHAYTKPSVDYIHSLLNEAYEKGMSYDVSDMYNAVFAFAASSTNSADKCIKLVSEMKFKSDDIALNPEDDVKKNLVFYDVEVFPNLFLVNWKLKGEGNPVVRMINPSPTDIEDLMKFNLVGFNCRRYDNHILYARLMGYTNEQLYNLSQRIINSEPNSLFGQAYNISYTDVYDFAAKKQSLKKWEIELGIHHQELGLPWDQPVPEERWIEVAEYCDNDVIATEVVFDHLSADFVARQILADLAGGSYNDTTNSLTTKIIFGNNRKPQSQFNYRDLSKPTRDIDEETYEFLAEIAPEMMSQTHGEAESLLPYFPGYEFKNGKSTYRGEDVGEGGYVKAKPGMWGNVALLDVASMHPHSAMMEVLFGVEFTKKFYDIVYGRVHIKHEAWDAVNKMLDGKLTPYVQKVINGEMSSKDLANALKIAINSVYGLTAANFDNPFRDIRNKDNIVAKRGALFMIDLMYEVEARGFVVAHIKTDSIKIPDATPEIIEFVMNFGKKYGYTFEHEATYERMCLVNDAVYIAKYADADACMKLYDYVPGDNKKHPGEWTATGTQFAVPYVFKTLFSKEPIVFEDMCETKSVKTALYLDMNEQLPDVTQYEKELDKAETQYKKGQLSDVIFEKICEDLNKKIDEGHDYQFIGKVGNFCPIEPGCGGGVLVAERNGKYNAATGTKGYRWLESEMIRGVSEDVIDKSYYKALVDNAVDTLIAYGDVEWFLSDDPYVGPQFVPGEEMAWPDYPEEEPFPKDVMETFGIKVEKKNK